MKTDASSASSSNKSPWYCRICGKRTAFLKTVCDDEGCRKKAEKLLQEDERKRHEDEREAAYRAKQKKIYRIFATPVLVERYQNLTFDELLVDYDNVEPLRASTAFARDFGRRGKIRLLWLCGETGRGKTYLAHAVTNYLIRHTKYKIAYFSVRCGILPFTPLSSQTADERRETARRRRHLEEADLVLIDDLGYEGEPAPHAFSRFLHELADRQYGKENGGIIITSELHPQDIQGEDKGDQTNLFTSRKPGRYGAGTNSLISRLREMGKGEAWRILGSDWRDPQKNRAGQAIPFPEWRSGVRLQETHEVNRDE